MQASLVPYSVPIQVDSFVEWYRLDKNRSPIISASLSTNCHYRVSFLTWQGRMTTLPVIQLQAVSNLNSVEFVHRFPLVAQTHLISAVVGTMVMAFSIVTPQAQLCLFTLNRVTMSSLPFKLIKHTHYCFSRPMRVAAIFFLWLIENHWHLVQLKPTQKQ